MKSFGHIVHGNGEEKVLEMANSKRILRHIIWMIKIKYFGHLVLDRGQEYGLLPTILSVRRSKPREDQTA